MKFEGAAVIYGHNGEDTGTIERGRRVVDSVGLTPRLVPEELKI